MYIEISYASQVPFSMDRKYVHRPISGKNNTPIYVIFFHLAMILYIDLKRSQREDYSLFGSMFSFSHHSFCLTQLYRNNSKYWNI